MDTACVLAALSRHVPNSVHFGSSALSDPWGSALGLRYGSELAIRMGHNRLEAMGRIAAACGLRARGGETPGDVRQCA
jgi:hypothetical protein